MAEFLSALLSIVVIDLVLAGDNAIVIGLAARNLPKDLQKKVIIWGTVGAIAIRSFATIIVVWLLKIPGLHLTGGILLVWIAYKLLVEEDNHEEVEAGKSFWAALQTIIIADALMGLDNVLAVAGAAHGSFLLVICGLIISIPIVIWGSTLIINWVERFPIIITIGAGVLAYTAANMITDEKFLHPVFDEPVVRWGFIVLVIAGVIFFGYRMKKKNSVKAAA